MPHSHDNNIIYWKGDVLQVVSNLKNELDKKSADLEAAQRAHIKAETLLVGLQSELSDAQQAAAEAGKERELMELKLDAAEKEKTKVRFSLIWQAIIL